MKFFTLMYIEDNSRMDRKRICVNNILDIFKMGAEIYNVEKEVLVLLLFQDGTRIDDDEYLRTVDDGTDLLICTKEQYEKIKLLYVIDKIAFWRQGNCNNNNN